MKSFLKKAGEIIVSAGAAVGSSNPLVSLLLGLVPKKYQGIEQTAVTDLTQLGQVVLTVESIGAALATPTGGLPLTGAQKLAAAAPLVGRVILQSDLMTGKHIKDQALFTQAVSEFAQATVDLLNAIDENDAAALAKA